MTLSIVSPVYNSANTIHTLIKEIKKSTVDFSIEIILVDDGSIDHSWQIIEEVCLQDSFVRGIKLKQNYGQHQAICAGLEQAIGEWIVVLDCDLQDNPGEIPKLFLQTKNNYQIILAKRINRKDVFWKKSTSYIFWKIVSLLSNTSIHPLVGNFGLYHKDVIAKFISSKSKEPYFSIAMQKFDFKRIAVETEHQERMKEESSYSFLKLIIHAKNVLLKTSGFAKPAINNYLVDKVIN